MPLKPVGEKCKLELYDDEDGPRLICANVDDCPVGHAGEIGPDCFGPIVIKNLDFTKGGSVQIGSLTFGAGSVVPDAGVQPPGPPSSSSSQDEVYEGPTLPQSRITPGTPKVESGTEKAVLTVKVGSPSNSGHKNEAEPPASDIPEVEPGAGKAGVQIAVGRERLKTLKIEGESGISPAPDSHMVVDKVVPLTLLNWAPPCKNPCYYLGTPACLQCPRWGEALSEDEKWWIRDLKREQAIQRYVDKLNEISMEMYLEQNRPAPSPIPTLGPEESVEFLRRLDDFTLTDEQRALCREAIEGFKNRRLKRRKCHIVRQSGGMIRMRGNKPERPEPEEENLFETDDEMHGPVPSNVRPEPELQRPLPSVERPEEPEEEEEDQEEAHGDLTPVREDRESVDGFDFLIDDMETTGTPESDPYVLNLEVQTDDEGDHLAVMCIDYVTIEIMLGDFIEIVEALERLLPRMRRIQSS